MATSNRERELDEQEWTLTGVRQRKQLVRGKTLVLRVKNGVRRIKGADCLLLAAIVEGDDRVELVERG